MRLFLNFIWKQCGMTFHCSRKLMFSWQPYFDRRVYKLEFSYNFHSVIFTFPRLFSIELLILIAFEKETQDGGCFHNMTQLPRDMRSSFRVITSKERFLDVLCTL